jgi:hypothetical protein
MHFSIRYIQVLRYGLQLSQESWIENRSVVPVAGMYVSLRAQGVLGTWQGLKAHRDWAMNAALKGRSSTVVQKACSSTSSRKAALPRYSLARLLAESGGPAKGLTR